MAWIISNLATIIISLVLIIAALAAGRYVHKSKKEGTCAGCGGGCSSCSHCSGTDPVRR